MLGGHTFFSELGNEPIPSLEHQTEIVEKCLEAGIHWFDTTHQPERTALGNALQMIGRRGDAHVIAWNFMKTLAPGDPLDRPTAFEPHHIQILQDQLQTDFIDAVVVHPVDEGTPEGEHLQLEVASEWVAAGQVGQLGVWSPQGRFQNEGTPISFMVEPCNVGTPDSPGIFAECKAKGWRTLACSPFVRGWELDRLVEIASERETTDKKELRRRLADHLLRFSLFSPNVDFVMTAMRRVEWIAPNLESERRGPLPPEDLAWLESILSW